jgi:hypothetical protein
MSLFCRRSAPISEAKATGGDIIMWPGISIMTSLVAMDSIAVAPLTPPVVSRLGHSILGNLAPFVSSHFLKTVMSSSSAIISSIITGGYEPDGQSFRGRRHQVIDERLHFLRPLNPFDLYCSWSVTPRCCSISLVCLRGLGSEVLRGHVVT